MQRTVVEAMAGRRRRRRSTNGSPDEQIRLEEPIYASETTNYLPQNVSLHRFLGANGDEWLLVESAGSRSKGNAIFT